ncbi:MAG TPA: citrate/2-methylcitrate synthase, partial [Acidimicrobiia bacterium]|nr:citrate/2-methylcitrate synthase [Acidimicrobiia bacterium]
MADAVLRFGDKELSLPTVSGTVSEVGMEIAGIRSELGLITIDRGFANTAESTSSVSYVGGEQGVLSYRGYPIEQLADQASFIEVAYLLQYGELPTKDQLAEYEESITRHTLLREDVKHLFEAFPHSAHPMQILASAT